MRDVVDGARHIGQQVRVAVAAPGDQHTDLDAFGLFGPGAEHRPALEVWAVDPAGGVRIEREEVVPVERDVDPGLLGAGHRVPDQPVVGRVLGLELDPDAHGPVRVRGRGW